MASAAEHMLRTTARLEFPSHERAIYRASGAAVLAFLIGSFTMILTGCEGRGSAASSSAVDSSAVQAAPAALEEPHASVAAPAVGVPAPAVAAANPQSYTTIGPLVVERQADVLAERDGYVTSVRAELGERVHKGQILALLDDRSDQAAYAAKAAHVESLKAQVREWEAEQKGNEADLRRADAMFSEKIISQEDEEHVKYKLEETIAEVGRYKAEAAAGESELRALSINIEQSRIVSPQGGVVGRRSIREAQEVKKGDPLFWITAEGPLHVVFTVPEAVMAAFPDGAGLALTTAVYPTLEQRATIIHVSPVVDPASGSIEVIALLVHPSPLLKPGMSMKVRLEQR